jgi:hypothetical protein
MESERIPTINGSTESHEKRAQAVNNRYSLAQKLPSAMVPQSVDWLIDTFDDESERPRQFACRFWVHIAQKE